MADMRTGSAAVGSRIDVRRADQRFHTQTNWLNSFHSFSFGPHYDPNNMGFGTLRVLNDDVIAPGQGFGTHPHRDMEIVTWVVKGAVAHQDSSGGQGVIRAGEVQTMSAGTGIRHSEYNASETEPVHLLQMWIEPAQPGLTPTYAEKAFPEGGRRNRLCWREINFARLSLIATASLKTAVTVRPSCAGCTFMSAG
jgi:redox-sensitive bicupin YhaK (pirin superfamily)